MAINFTNETGYANNIRNQKTKLLDAISKLENCKSSMASNWTAQEVTYISQAIDNEIARLRSVISKLEGLSDDIVSKATAIKKEEEAAAKKAKEQRLKAQREKEIKEAQDKYDKAEAEYKKLENEYKKLEKDFNKTKNLSEKLKLGKKMIEKSIELKAAEELKDSCEAALKNAKSGN